MNKFCALRFSISFPMVVSDALTTRKAIFKQHMNYISVKGFLLLLFKLTKFWHNIVVEALEKTSGMKVEEEIEEAELMRGRINRREKKTDYNKYTVTSFCNIL